MSVGKIWNDHRSLVASRIAAHSPNGKKRSPKHKHKVFSRVKAMSDTLIAPGSGRPRILISNDDGINAPGLRALVAELHVEEFCDIIVCSPSGERSAQSHAITLGKDLVCTPIKIDGDEPSSLWLWRFLHEVTAYLGSWCHRGGRGICGRWHTCR